MCWSRPSSHAAPAAISSSTASASTSSCTSQLLLNELRDVLEKKLGQRAIDVRAALHLFGETFTLVAPDTLDPPACRDHDDDVVLATALAGECVAIITGDQDLLILNPFRGIHVLAPSAFWKWEAEHVLRFEPRPRLRPTVDLPLPRGSP